MLIIAQSLQVLFVKPFYIWQQIEGSSANISTTQESANIWWAKQQVSNKNKFSFQIRNMRTLELYLIFQRFLLKLKCKIMLLC